YQPLPSLVIDAAAGAGYNDGYTDWWLTGLDGSPGGTVAGSWDLEGHGVEGRTERRTGEVPGYLPLKSGLRFSLKARTASTRSSVRMIDP
ncbi:MAG TPA: hypothetical protein VNI57_05175, partial [Candidatus Saccharimonadales bacterium]|nr:hypothetical protein [Candidatus Saccharimonadales bacterium]